MIPKPSTLEQLKFDRTQELIDLVSKNGPNVDATVFFLAGNGYRLIAQDGTPIAFWFDIPSAYIQAVDMNRIESWTVFLREVMGRYGYTAKTQGNKTNWAMLDFVNRSQMDRIQRNVEALQTGFFRLPDWRELVYANLLGWERMNAIEWDLQRIWDYLNFMEDAFLYCGEAECGAW